MNLTASEVANNPRFAQTLRAANRAFKKVEFIERADGFRERVWGNPYEDYTTDADVVAWLKGLRAVEDLESGLEFVRESYIAKMVKEDMLRKVGAFHIVTAKCAERYKLPKVMGRAFPK